LRLWRTAYASAAGTSHARAGSPCQDAGRCDVIKAADGSEILIASVSDGAGSASQSEHGARLAVEIFQQTFSDLARDDPDLRFLCEDRAYKWLAGLQKSIAIMAEENGFQLRDYACTFLGAIVASRVAAFLQIGDGAIVVTETEDANDDYTWVFWPQHGEFANSTFFVTMENASQIMEFERRETPDERSCVREVVMFSDGLERLILDMRGRTVHSPSVRPILSWLAGSEPAPIGQPSNVLAAYLNSPNVNRRTDDDKTLVMATRVAPVPPEAAP